jgi:hypothetical protein
MGSCSCVTRGGAGNQWDLASNAHLNERWRPFGGVEERVVGLSCNILAATNWFAQTVNQLRVFAGRARDPPIAEWITRWNHAEVHQRIAFPTC